MAHRKPYGELTDTPNTHLILHKVHTLHSYPNAKYLQSLFIFKFH